MSRISCALKALALAASVCTASVSSVEAQMSASPNGLFPAGIAVDTGSAGPVQTDPPEVICRAKSGRDFVVAGFSGLNAAITARRIVEEQLDNRKSVFRRVSDAVLGGQKIHCFQKGPELPVGAQAVWNGNTDIKNKLWALSRFYVFIP